MVSTWSTSSHTRSYITRLSSWDSTSRAVSTPCSTTATATSGSVRAVASTCDQAVCVSPASIPCPTSSRRTWPRTATATSGLPPWAAASSVLTRRLSAPSSSSTRREPPKASARMASVPSPSHTTRSFGSRPTAAASALTTSTPASGRATQRPTDCPTTSLTGFWRTERTICGSARTKDWCASPPPPAKCLSTAAATVC